MLAVNSHVKHFRNVHKTILLLTKNVNIFSKASPPSSKSRPEKSRIARNIPSEWGAQVVMVTGSLLVYYDYY